MAQLLDELDQQWSHGHPADLSSLIARVPSSESELVWELCAADLEWRWRSNSGEDVAVAVGSVAATPIAADYRFLLADQWEDSDCKRNLLEAEWCARSIWGDAPDVDEFAAQMPIFPDWSTHLAKELNSLVPLEVELQSKLLKRPMTARVSHEFVIGRQGVGEPKAPAWIVLPARLIVANLHYRVISREQLKVRRTRLREVELVNVSRSTGGWWGNHQLGPGESTRLHLPSSINVGELIITIRFDDQLAVGG